MWQERRVSGGIFPSSSEADREPGTSDIFIPFSESSQ